MLLLSRLRALLVEDHKAVTAETFVECPIGAVGREAVRVSKNTLGAVVIAHTHHFTSAQFLQRAVQGDSTLHGRLHLIQMYMTHLLEGPYPLYRWHVPGFLLISSYLMRSAYTTTFVMNFRTR